MHQDFVGDDVQDPAEPVAAVADYEPEIEVEESEPTPEPLEVDDDLEYHANLQPYNSDYSDETSVEEPEEREQDTYIDYDVADGALMISEAAGAEDDTIGDDATQDQIDLVEPDDVQPVAEIEPDDIVDPDPDDVVVLEPEDIVEPETLVAETAPPSETESADDDEKTPETRPSLPLDFATLASDLVLGRTQVVVLAGGASHRDCAVLADVLAGEALDRGLSVALVDAGSGIPSTEPGIADLSLDEARLWGRRS
ncbi:hypothetical protein PSQ19_02145 [Devosia algicola]|uniref:Uncharacterized protein n=1 Tax=Devosia algicola TaxID=3026418 RepID=A0ABY7YP43_9HYPH|nr:hypothetical protein [Devosia algicola]WDR03031.1 hypothetical protein PSQ19_02145 [Devosia algicola]